MSGPAYRAAPPDSFRTAPLDGLTALFHRPSGQTHLVTEPVPEILAALQQPMSAGALLAHLGHGDADRPALDARLAELIAIGLIWPA